MKHIEFLLGQKAANVETNLATPLRITTFTRAETRGWPQPRKKICPGD